MPRGQLNEKIEVDRPDEAEDADFPPDDMAMQIDDLSPDVLPGPVPAPSEKVKLGVKLGVNAVGVRTTTEIDEERRMLQTLRVHLAAPDAIESEADSGTARQSE